MKRILIVFDGMHFSKSAFDFANRLNANSPILLTGIFLSSAYYNDVIELYLGGMAGPLANSFTDSDNNAINDNIRQFKRLCENNNIAYKIHTEVDVPVVDAVKKETRYADLLILSSELFYINMGSALHEAYLKDTMHYSDCPMVIVPEQYNFPTSLVLSFDGSRSCIFAIKQFAYLFPQLTSLSTLIIYSSAEAGDVPDLPYIQEFGYSHFKNSTLLKLDIDAKKYFNTWLAECGNAMLVAGAYGRSGLSEIFKKSFAEEVIKDHKLPVFIAHM